MIVGRSPGAEHVRAATAGAFPAVRSGAGRGSNLPGGRSGGDDVRMDVPRTPSAGRDARRIEAAERAVRGGVPRTPSTPPFPVLAPSGRDGDTPIPAPDEVLARGQ